MKYAEGGDPHKFSRDEIARIVKHSAENSDDALVRYAKPLSCPQGMFLVDMPPNRGNKPFFKVCVDRYEYPDRAGTVPRTNIAFDEARRFCSQQGKRLCNAVEWMWACSGIEGLAYPYGNNFDQSKCNADTRLVESSGNKANCVSPWGGYDMAGNIFEWVITDKNKLALMGGPLSKCQTVSPAQNGDAKPQSGLRCCKSN
jgi:formylglycine-generating enzyme required for sulfatase activity